MSGFTYRVRPVTTRHGLFFEVEVEKKGFFFTRWVPVKSTGEKPTLDQDMRLSNYQWKTASDAVSASYGFLGSSSICVEYRP